MTKYYIGKVRNAGFSNYLRTGRVVTPARPTDIEMKFNPWHDPDDGRFTFAGAGEYFGSGSGAAPTARMSKPPKQDDARRRLAASAGREEVTDAERSRKERQRELRDPKNFTPYVVKPGDNLTQIAKSRRGLSASFLAQLNGVIDPNMLPQGQVLRLPKQEWLDINEAALERFKRRLFYLRRHGLPPIPRTPEEASRQVDLRNLPSIEDQIVADLKTFSANGYSFQADPYDGVAYRAYGKLQFGIRGKRSKKEQLRAGGSDRRKTDHGGHLIASDFNGPGEWFNHFAQNGNFNNSAFRKVEIEWAKLGKAGHEVYVDITVHRKDLSRRPHEIEVIWKVDGQRRRKIFPNEAGMK